MFPEIDTSFLGDAGPLPMAPKPHWSKHVNQVILVRETYSTKDTVKTHVGPVVLVKVDTRKGTLFLQRVIKRETFSATGRAEKVGPPYHIACRDCQFIATLSDTVK